MSDSKKTLKYTINAAFFQEIKEDHQQLHDLLCRLRKVASLGPALPNHALELEPLLSELCDRLALHFSLEEAYGYFEDLVEVTPHLHLQTGKLRAQHATLFVMIRDLADAAAARHKGSTDDLRRIAERFHEFDEALKVHENAESQLIFTAMNQDVGVGD